MVRGALELAKTEIAEIKRRGVAGVLESSLVFLEGWKTVTVQLVIDSFGVGSGPS